MFRKNQKTLIIMPLREHKKVQIWCYFYDNIAKNIEMSENLDRVFDII